MAYAKARSDFEYLESLAELGDQVELDSERIYLMQEPTKQRACDMYESAIRLWFGENGGSFDTNRRVRGIRERYCF